MRVHAAWLAFIVLTACGHPSEDVPLEPPPRPDFQVSDLPPGDFLAAELMVEVNGDRKPYCLRVRGLLEWFEEQNVREQNWTQLDERRWRLDGYDRGRQEHTVWVFEQDDDGVELVGYKDSDRVERTHQSIMRIYYPYLVYDLDDDCQSPFD